MSKMNVEELVSHLKKPGSKNTFVIGPYIDDYELLSEEDLSIYNLKGVVKNNEAFYNTHLNKILKPINNFIDVFIELGLHEIVTSVYAQSVHGALATFDATFLKGDGYSFKCLSCQKEYPLEAMMEGVRVCSCGKKIRPNCLLGNELYDMKRIIDFEDVLKKSDTIFLIGFDFNELELCRQLEVIGANKASGKKLPVIVVVGECAAQAVYDTFQCDFIVDEKVIPALKRFIKYL